MLGVSWGKLSRRGLQDATVPMESRTVMLEGSRPTPGFAHNGIKTSKYNPVTFFPIFLFEMFSRAAYLYFLIQVRGCPANAKFANLCTYMAVLAMKTSNWPHNSAPAQHHGLSDDAHRPSHGPTPLLCGQAHGFCCHTCIRWSR